MYNPKSRDANEFIDDSEILESLDVDKVHVIYNGKVVAEGDASLIDEINENGFEKYMKE